MAGTINLSQMQTGTVGGLGAALDELDVLVSRLGSRQTQTAFSILHLLDRISAQLEESSAHGANIKAEEGQFESACAVIRRQAATLVREAGGEAGLRAERQTQNPPPQAWWWWLDEQVAQKRKTSLVNGIKVLGVLLVVVVILVFVYQRFLAPSPQVVARIRAVQNATDLAGAGNFVQSLTEIQQGLAISPNDTELLVWEGVLYQLQEKDAQAEQIFTRAKTLLSRDEDFFIERSQIYYAIGKLTNAEQDAANGTTINPNSEVAFFVLGTVQEAEKKMVEAFQSYQKAVDLANLVNNSTIAVEAKVKMGYMMQAGGGLSIETPSPTP
jgi:tetratricopeptide (TPR) repeat protein